MTRKTSRDIARIFRDGSAIDRAMVLAQRRVIIRHRQLGVPLAIWRDGKVVELDPDTVELPEAGDDPNVSPRRRSRREP